MAKIVGDVNFEGGQIINVRAEKLAALPSFTAGEDEGRFLFVTTGPDVGYWFGAFDGSSAFSRLNLGSTLTDYTLSNQAVNDGVTFAGTITPTGAPAKVADVVKVDISSTDVTSGQVRVVLYEDAGRTSEFYNSVFDMSAPQEDRIPAFFELDNETGDIYIDIVNNSGANGSFTVDLTIGGRILVNTPPPPGDGSGVNAGVAGDGISYDAVNTRLDIILSGAPGLQLTGAAGSRVLSALASPGGGIVVDGTGISVGTTVLKTDADRTVEAGSLLSVRDKIAILPNASPGPPALGAHVAGEIYRDVNIDKWECVVGGAPGDWVFFGFKEESFGGALDGTSYTATIAADSSVVLELTTTGRRGWIRKMSLWGADPAYAASDIDVTMRVAAYPNENREGREQLWLTTWQLRKTFATAIASIGANAIEVNDLGLANNDDLVRVRAAAGVTEEYQRVLGRDVANNEIDVDETLIDALGINDNVMFVTEIIDAPVRNNSATPGEEFKVFLEIFNDDATQAVVVGFDILLENVGGGIPV